MSTVQEALDVLLRFGRMMLRAGDTAFRVHDSMIALAGRLGIESLSVQIAIDGMAATARRGGELVTITSKIGPPGINAWRISALESWLASAEPPSRRTPSPGNSTPSRWRLRCVRSPRWRSQSVSPRAPSPT